MWYLVFFFFLIGRPLQRAWRARSATACTPDTCCVSCCCSFFCVSGKSVLRFLVFFAHFIEPVGTYVRGEGVRFAREAATLRCYLCVEHGTCSRALFSYLVTRGPASHDHPYLCVCVCCVWCQFCVVTVVVVSRRAKREPRPSTPPTHEREAVCCVSFLFHF